MKKFKLFFIAIFLISPFLSFSQNLSKEEIIKIIDSIHDKNKRIKRDKAQKIKCYNLFSEIKHIKYGTPLCLKVDSINPFLTKSFSTYTPINFDFSTDAFTALNIQETKEEGVEKITEVPVKLNKYAKLNANLESTFNEKMMDLFNLLEKENTKPEEIKKLEKEIERLKSEIEETNLKVKAEIDKNKALQKKYDSIYNVTIKSNEFKATFSQFQNHFDKINKYTSLRDLLLMQINKDSVFIKNVENFKNRATSNFKVVYRDTIKYSDKKNDINTELTNLQNTYVTLQQKYQELNKLYKNDKLILSGELKTKDKKNSLKFEKVIASLETEYLFENEMSKAKAINDSLTKPVNKKKLTLEAYDGIDLYDEILNATYSETIRSQNIYDDAAEIKLQLKNSKGKVMHDFGTYNVKTYGRIKINGSAGYFINFTTDDNFTLRKKNDTDTSSKAGVVKTDKNRIKNALGGMLHVYWDIKGDFDFGISAGLSVNEDSKTAFYLGLSGLFTEKNRLVFTAGLSFLKINKLNKANLILEEGVYNFINELDTEIRYDEIYKPSFFIGISYNLAKQK